MAAMEPTDLCNVVAMSVTSIMFLMNFGALFASVDPNSHPAEDAKLGITDAKKEEYNQLNSGGSPSRVNRIANNQMEQFPMALFVLWGAKLVGGAPHMVMLAFLLYLLWRVLYIFMYKFALQPGRTIIFLFGQLTVFFAMVVGILGALKVYPATQ
eukprot:CAMPEP_0172912222 /NCGR_PEP_ID=MMETSP1075-20121228/188001_1 /TAXON_ID=2916 /ORGANISM="Ceratium fusus, Strain PA161109" /LENGTH=154 /DNA_ID=CAMNT_0013770665 /DNA_START=53 /DNA_END=517 /DNA_ORIENTATION=-